MKGDRGEMGEMKVLEVDASGQLLIKKLGCTTKAG